MENLTLSSSMLKPMADLLEGKIQGLMTSVLKKNKTGEITLKIELSTIDREQTTKDDYGNESTKTWTEPNINFQLSEKIKETKEVVKGSFGYGYKIETDELMDDIYVQEVK